MVVVMDIGADESRIEAVIATLNDHGFDVHRSSGSQRTVLGAVGVQPDFDKRHIELLEGVYAVHRVSEPYKFASRSWKKEPTKATIKDVVIGGEEVIVMAGPCSVESEEQIHASAEAVAKAGARILRGGAFKPRSSPYSFQGLGEKGLIMMREAADAHGLAVVTELMDPAHADLDGQVRRHGPDRGPQHAELSATEGGWSAGIARTPEAGHVRQHRRMAQER